ncbi:NUDIX domain-containing protein [uncultured Erythrobacter sp.]|uniref:NUDIX hydrolase n=1 Tax=uncultured Erythrobacter sp. TaxID=263913 RepID=UPI002619EF32|nr:NUDIX domain-containing protein [uncultured Erythrobacter sp.]
MTEEEFLRSYDAKSFERPSVAVDLVLMSVRDGQVVAVLQQRSEHPYQGHWALPGGFVQIGESPDEAATRILKDKAGMDQCFLEQLYTFGAPDRDPRTHVISIAHFALLPFERFEKALDRKADLALATIDVPWKGEAGGAVRALDRQGSKLSLAFDHDEILGLAVKRLRGRLDYSPIAFALLPALFTLRDLQDVHQAILGVEFRKPAFRRRMLDAGWIKGTGKKESGQTFRPAELYTLKKGVKNGTD